MHERIYTIPVNTAFEQHDDCPFCLLYKQLEATEIDLITGASMMEPDVRVRTNKLGFCRHHFDMMYENQKRLSLALTIQSHLEELKKEISAGGFLSRDAAAKPVKRIGELNGIFKRLYEDSVSGRITDERFMELSTDYEQEQATLKARAAELQAELGQAQEAAVNVEKFMAVVRKYTSFEELTPTLLREFVEKIVVHECWKDEQGTRHQDIEIYYSFVGKVDLPDD